MLFSLLQINIIMCTNHLVELLENAKDCSDAQSVPGKYITTSTADKREVIQNANQSNIAAIFTHALCPKIAVLYSLQTITKQLRAIIR